MPSEEMMVEFLGGPYDGHLQYAPGNEDEPEPEMELPATETQPSTKYYFGGYSPGMACRYVHEPLWNAFIKSLEFKVCDPPVMKGTPSMGNSIALRQEDVTFYNMEGMYAWTCHLCKRLQHPVNWDESLEVVQDDFEEHKRSQCEDRSDHAG